MPTAKALVLLLACVGCSSQSFEAPPSAENEELVLAVHRWDYRSNGRKPVQVWITLKNKTAETLGLVYRGIELEVGDRSYECSFELQGTKNEAWIGPGMLFKPAKPLKFLDVDAGPRAAVVFRDLRRRGAKQAAPLRVEFPFKPQ